MSQSTILRNEYGVVNAHATAHQTVFTRFVSAREFTTMLVLHSINQQLPDVREHLSLNAVAAALLAITRSDNRLIRTMPGRYTWAWALPRGPRGVEVEEAGA